MTRDLFDLMHDDVAARERSVTGAGPDEAALAGSVRRVRRNRAVRHSLQAGVAGVAVVVVAGASWIGLRGYQEPAPATTPTPSVSVSPTPAPTTSVAPVVLDEIVGLPPTRALPPGLWENTTAGWVLTIYRSLPYSADGQTSPVVNTVVLVSPDGERYRVVDLPKNLEVTLLDWEAGSTTAVVSTHVDYEENSWTPRAVLDLLTGQLTPSTMTVDGAPVDPAFVGIAEGGAELWALATSTDAYTSDLYRRQADGSLRLLGGVGYEWLVDPTGRWLASNVPGAFSDSEEPFALVDLTGGGSTELSYGVPGKTCDMVGWLDPGRLLAFCLDAGYREAELDDAAAAHAAYYRIEVGPAGATATHLADLTSSDPKPWTWQGAWAGDGTALFAGTSAGLTDPSGCASDAYLWQGDGPAAVPTGIAPGDTTYAFGSGPLGTYAMSGLGCSAGASPPTLRRVDVATRQATVLAPAPPTTAEVAEWATGLSTWVVGRAG